MRGEKEGQSYWTVDNDKYILDNLKVLLKFTPGSAFYTCSVIIKLCNIDI